MKKTYLLIATILCGCIYFKANAQSGDSNVIYVDSGKVGINNSDPKYPLDVHGIVKADSFVLSNGLPIGGGINNNYWTTTNGAQQFKTNDSVRLTITNSGDIQAAGNMQIGKQLKIGTHSLMLSSDYDVIENTVTNSMYTTLGNLLLQNINSNNVLIGYPLDDPTLTSKLNVNGDINFTGKFLKNGKELRTQELYGDIPITDNQFELTPNASSTTMGSLRNAIDGDPNTIWMTQGQGTDAWFTVLLDGGGGYKMNKIIVHCQLGSKIGTDPEADCNITLQYQEVGGGLSDPVSLTSSNSTLTSLGLIHHVIFEIPQTNYNGIRINMSQKVDPADINNAFLITDIDLFQTGIVKNAEWHSDENNNAYWDGGSVAIGAMPVPSSSLFINTTNNNATAGIKVVNNTVATNNILKYGLYLSVEQGADKEYGVFSNVGSVGSTNEKYGVYSRIYGSNSYGVFSTATGANSYAGFFEGNVKIDGTLTTSGFNPGDNLLLGASTSTPVQLDLNKLEFNKDAGTAYISNAGSQSKLAFATAGTTRMLIDENGNIGIGTPTPLSKLDVRGSVYIPTGQSYWIGSTSDAGNRLRMHHDGTNAMIDYSQNLYFRYGTTTGVTFTSNGCLGINTVSPDPQNKLHVEGNTYISGNTSINGNTYFSGNVGIGTTTPQCKLVVDGKIRALEMEVVMPGNIDIPDYVFDKNYKLPSLLEVENYVNKNKHLLDVPSAQEIREKGINVAQMDNVLLKKLEEITLYLIEQNKQLQKQNEIIEKQQQELERLKNLVLK